MNEIASLFLIQCILPAFKIFSEALTFREVFYAIRAIIIIGLVVMVVIMTTCGLMRHRKNQSVRSTVIFVCVIIGALFISNAIMVQFHIKGEKRQQEIDKLRLRAIEIGYELKQSSDGLTRFVRYYCLTGNPIYEQYFHLISKIRDGKIPHPSNYSLSYWDHVISGDAEIDELGETYAIEDKMQQLGLTKEELQKLRQAKKDSDDLINLETVAMNAVKGRFQDANGQFTIQGEPNPKLAQSIVFGEDYHAAKSKIMQSINEFTALLETRVAKELERVQARDNTISYIIAILTFATIGVVTCFMLLLVRTIVIPLRSLEKASQKLAEGHYEIVPLSGKNNEINRLTIAFNFMVSERKTYEETLKHSQIKTLQALKNLESSEMHFRSLVTNIPGAVYRCELDSDWTMHYISDHIEKISGYPVSDFIENRLRSYASIIHPEDKKDVKGSVHASIERTGFFVVEYRIVHRNGEVRWVFERGHVIKKADGDVRYLDGFIMDITERKKVEDALRGTLSQLEESEQQLDLVNKSAGLAVWKTDFNKRKTYFTPIFEKIFGYQPGEFLNLDHGKWCTFRDETQEFRSLVHPDDLEYYDLQRKRFFEERREMDFEFRARFADEQWRWVRTYGRVTEWDAKIQAQSAHGVLIDIDHMKRLQLQLIAAKDDAESANRAKSIFLANMSHEIRTPMNAILGHSQILQRDKNLPEGQRKSVGSIIRSGEHLLSVINDILDMSKIEAGKMTLSPISFDLVSTLRELETMFAAKARQKGLELTSEFSPDLPQIVFADEYRLKQVVINLLGNAFKFTLSGSVRLSATREGDFIDICVSDTGCGVSQDHVDLIFGAFAQSKTGKQFTQGTGLGLSISKNIAKMMGGDIRVHSEEGKGSHFHFTFLYESGQPEDLVTSRPDKVITGIKPGQRRVKILIVDDKEENRTVAKLLLEPMGFGLKEAVNGEDGLIIADAWKPDIVLMDIAMPVMDGREASRVIKKQRWGNDVKIIAVSASTIDDAQKTMLENGADAFIKKPYRDWELLEEIGRCAGIEYEYESIEAEPDTAIATTDYHPSIAGIPADLRADIRRAARLGDVSAIRRQVKSLSKYDREVAKFVANLVENYDFQIIGKLFEPE